MTNALALARTSARRWFVVLLCVPLFLISAVSQAASYTLYIKAGTHTINGAGGTTLKAWGFTDNPSTGPMVPGPLLESQEGETVTVTVYNQHTLAAQFRGTRRDHRHGLDPGRFEQDLQLHDTARRHLSVLRHAQFQYEPRDGPVRCAGGARCRWSRQGLDKWPELQPRACLDCLRHGQAALERCGRQRRHGEHRYLQAELFHDERSRWLRCHARSEFGPAGINRPGRIGAHCQCRIIRPVVALPRQPFPGHRR